MSTITISKKITSKKIKLDRYAGKWVAFVNGEIVAYNETLKDLMEEIDKKGLRKKASVFLVPRRDEGPYVSFNLLGRDNFFLPFIISFFEKNKKIILKTGK